MVKTLYLIAGANGSGKTTLAHELLREEKGLVFLNADEVAAKIGDDLGLSAGKIILSEIDKMIAAKKSFVMESTISGNHHLNVLNKARKAGYKIVLIYVFLDMPEFNLARIRNRVALGGHNVPEDAVRRRYGRSLKNFADVKKISDRWELYYNGGEKFLAVARGNGQESVLDDAMYKKFKGLHNVNA